MAGHGQDEEADDVYEKEQCICAICGKQFSCGHSLTRHIESVHANKRPFSCKYCSKAFKRTDHLSVHIDKVHLPKRPHRCQLCSWAFKRKDHLAVHMLKKHTGQHEGKKKKTMRFARKSTAPHTKLVARKSTAPHTKLVARKKTSPYPDIGDQQTSQSVIKTARTKLQESSADTTRERKFECGCGKAFYAKSHLMEHVDGVHFGLGRKKAAILKRKQKKVLSKKSKIVGHTSSVETYGCELCNMAFGRLKTLIRHLKEAHHPKDSRNHLCWVCGKSLPTAKHLTSHLLAYT